MDNVPVMAGVLNDVSISRVENGFIIRVGCKTFISHSWEEVSAGLGMYFTDPVRAQKVYCKETK
jgi:hypothetical protein